MGGLVHFLTDRIEDDLTWHSGWPITEPVLLKQTNILSPDFLNSTPHSMLRFWPSSQLALIADNVHQQFAAQAKVLNVIRTKDHKMGLSEVVDEYDRYESTWRLRFDQESEDGISWWTHVWGYTWEAETRSW